MKTIEILKGKKQRIYSISDFLQLSIVVLIAIGMTRGEFVAVVDILMIGDLWYPKRSAWTKLPISWLQRVRVESVAVAQDVR